MDTENTVVNETPGDAADNEQVQTTETGVDQTGAADPQKDESQRFSFALKKRLEEERPKIAKEVEARYAADIGFADSIRKAFSGASDDQIMENLTEAQVKAFARDNEISETLARQFIEMKRATYGLVKPQPKAKETTPKTSDVWMSRLAKQRQAILDEHGVDVLEGISAEEEALVMQGEADLREVFTKRTKSQTPPVNRNTSAASATVDFDKMSDEEFEAYRRQREGGR